MITADRTIPAPADLGIDVIGVPVGSDLDLEIRLESVAEGVLVTGTSRAHLVGECVRCLDPVEGEISTPFQELFFHAEQEVEGADEDEILRLTGDQLDLEPVVRDSLVPALPLAPVCRDDCPGLCPECGARLADDPGHGHEVIDPRWAALAELPTDGND
jgi:uncharacterized protein